MFATRITNVRPSGIRQMFELASKDAIHLGLGEPDFQPPRAALDAVKRAVDEGHNKYGPTPGLPRLRKLIAERCCRYDKNLTMKNVLVTAGGTEALMATMLTFIEPGDEVLIPDPGFPLYGPQTTLCGGKGVTYGLTETNDFLPDIEELQSKITSKTKAILTNSPSNPTGGVLDREHVNAIADVAEDKNLLIITDEVYDEIIYEGWHHSFLGRYDRVVHINSLSKTYALTGWRVGYILTNRDFFVQLRKAHYYIIACPPTPLQHGAIAALRSDTAFIDDMVREFKRRRKFIVERLNAIDGFSCKMPHGAFYAFPRFEFGMSSKELAYKLLEHNVICTPGAAFGAMGEGHLRFSYANSMDNIERGMDIVAEVAAELR